ncbi:MAG: hypothetical protein ACLFO6_08130 [Archaeoglobaceae archaeon]
MSENVVPQCVSITTSKTQAIASINPYDKRVRIIYCTNSDSCQQRGLLKKGCPHTCEVVVSAKRFSQERRVRADISEVSPEKLDQIAVSAQSGISTEPSEPFKILP